jgi:curli biogenesis system outer membrane secretion channel CsgG
VCSNRIIFHLRESILRYAVFCILLLTAQTGWTEYLAYSVTDNSKKPLPENIDGVDAKHLINIEWGAFAGGKSRVAILEVDNTSTADSFVVVAGISAASYGNSQVPVNGIEAIVTDAVSRTGRFRLVERQVLDQVLGEQDLAASGRVAGPSGATTGVVLGAQYLVQVVVTDYENKVQSTSKGFGGLLKSAGLPSIGEVNLESGEGRVGLNFRIIDANTSEVMFTKQIESIIKEAGVSFSGGTAIDDLGLGGFISDYSRTPVGQAVIAGINKGVYELVKEIGVQVATGSVVKAEGEQVWLNLGADSVAVGDRLNVISKGEELIDPETGISLGSSDTVLGAVEVAQVEEKYSIARNVSMSSTPSRGDKVKALEVASGMEFAGGWKN